MLTATTTTVQTVREVAPSGSEPIGSRMLNAAATPPTIPPSCRIFDNARTIQSTLTQPIRPNFGGTSLYPVSAGLPVAIVQRASSIWTATFTVVEMMTIHSSTKPTSAPSAVVAISSPEPTIDAL